MRTVPPGPLLPPRHARTGLPRQAAEHLIAVAAMSDFGLGRRELLWQLGLLLPSVDGEVSRLVRRRPQRSLNPAG
jgi:hypothetical protein